MSTRKRAVRVWRIAAALCLIFGFAALSYLVWQPGLDIRDGRHDRGSNGIWIAHGWLGADQWFYNNLKTNEFEKYRDVARIRALAGKLREHGITDVFPHLCPAEPTGDLPPVDARQVEKFLDVFEGFRVLPWIGGPHGVSARPSDLKWRKQFVGKVRGLLETHPRFAGVH